MEVTDLALSEGHRIWLWLIRCRLDVRRGSEFCVLSFLQQRSSSILNLGIYLKPSVIAHLNKLYAQQCVVVDEKGERSSSKSVGLCHLDANAEAGIVTRAQVVYSFICRDQLKSTTLWQLLDCGFSIHPSSGLQGLSN
jgi:hypothetical protein